MAVLLNEASTSLQVDRKPFKTESLPQRKFACTFDGCTKSYTKQCRLTEHQRSHTGQRPFVCETCQASFTRDTHLTAHKRKHQSEADKPFSCSFQDCDKRFWTRQHLNNHVKVKHECPMHQCPDCPESFSKEHLLRSHIAEEHSAPGTLPFQCDYEDCTKSFSTGSKLRSHKKTHDENRYACAHPDCLALEAGPPHFSNWTQLQKHNKADHAPRCSFVDCEGTTFKNHKGLVQHLAAEHGQTPEGEAVSPKKRKRKVKKIESETEQTTETEPQASSSKTLSCPFDDCTFNARKQKALDRHISRAHAEPRNSTLELLTGRNYAAPTPEVEDEGEEPSAKRRKLDRKYPCPLKEASGCAFVFKRVYDCERHLSAFHDVTMGRDDLALLFQQQ